MPLTVHVPDSLSDVISAMQDGAMVIAGGTSVMPRLNVQPDDIPALVSLRHAGLSGIEVSGTAVTVGAATTLSQMATHDALAFLRPAIESIASPSVRNLATVGGNLLVEHPYGDLAVGLLALGAEVDLDGADGPRTIPVEDVAVALAEGRRIVTAVRFSVPEAAQWHFTKAMRRRQNSAAIVTIAAVVEQRDGIVTDVRVALGGLGAGAVRAGAAEQLLRGGPLDRDRVEAAARAAAEDVAPVTDAYASGWYRKRVLPVHIRRALLGE
jgi:CO/xanthine dehydrogenase FAD-binding subunit